MSNFKKLAGQTAIYGLSSIAGRFLNYLLLPIYTRVFIQAEYGVITQVYAYIAFLNILFTYGLETAFFRFFQSEKNNSRVYATGLVSIIITSVMLMVIIIIFADPIANLIVGNIPDGAFYIRMFAGILAGDAITAIPFARLRQQNRAKRFAFIRIAGIVINVVLNIFFLMVCPWLLKSGYSGILNIYDPSMGVGYVFIANLSATAFTLLLLIPELKIRFNFDLELWKRMIIYAFPLMIAGFAGMINETFDRVMIPYLTPDKSTAMSQLGIYGACYKLSIVMTLFIQTFRYAAEPFFFNQAAKENPQQTYSQVMKYFVIICSVIFLGVMLYIDVVKYMIGPDFRSGLGIVPVLLLANLCLGVYYNLSIWYKISASTRWGAWISVFGAIVTLSFNFWLIPIAGFYGAAWATLICYASMMIVSYFLGQKYYPVNYDLKSFFYYTGTAVLFWLASIFFRNILHTGELQSLIINTMLMAIFTYMVWRTERDKISYLRARRK